MELRLVAELELLPPVNNIPCINQLSPIQYTIDTDIDDLAGVLAKMY